MLYSSVGSGVIRFCSVGYGVVVGIGGLQKPPISSCCGVVLKWCCVWYNACMAWCDVFLWGVVVYNSVWYCLVSPPDNILIAVWCSMVCLDCV